MVSLGPDSHTIEKEGNGFNFKFFIVEKGHKYNTNEGNQSMQNCPQT